MKSLIISAALAACALASGSALADAGLDLAKSKNCLACHALDHKVVGPAYKDIT